MCLTRLANPKLVRQSVPDERAADTSQSQSAPTPIAEPSKRETFNMEQNESSGVSLIRESLDRYDLSSSASICLHLLQSHPPLLLRPNVQALYL